MPTMFRALFIATLAVSLTACSFPRETEPERTATEQLLFSTAMDRVGAALALEMNKETKVYVEEKYAEGTDAKYLIATIRDLDIAIKHFAVHYPIDEVAAKVIPLRAAV